MKSMMKRRSSSGLVSVVVALASVSSAFCQQIGQFEQQSDIGNVLHPGSASFDSAVGTYSISGSGENMWAMADAFHFVWKKISGDVSFTSDVTFPTATGNPHKKAALIIRQSLDPDSPYVDVALHVVGLTSLQYRTEKGAVTHEVGIDGEGATRLRLEKRGAYFYMYVARKGEDLHFSGGSIRLELQEPFYIGLGVCAHDKDALETAVFSNVSIDKPKEGKRKLYSILETISVSSTDRRIVSVFPGRVEAPSWASDGTLILFRKGSRIEQIPATGGNAVSATEIKHAKSLLSGSAASPDGLREASQSYWEYKPKETLLTVKTRSDGQTKVLATFLGRVGSLSEKPWSPDGKRLVYVSYQMVPQE